MMNHSEVARQPRFNQETALTAPATGAENGRLRVLLTTDYYPPHYGGGAEATLPVVAWWLTRQGHTVMVVTLNTQHAAAVEERDGVLVHRVATWPLDKVLGLQFSLSPSLLGFLSRRVKEFRPDIIWAHNHFFTTSLAAHWAARWHRVPVLTDLSLADVAHLPSKERLLAQSWERTLGRWMLRRSAVVTGVSQACIDHAMTLLGRRSVPTLVVPNGVDTNKFYPAERPPQPLTIGFVGRLIQNKGPQRLMEAIPLVLAQEPGARFVFIGDGPMRAELTARAAALGVEPAIEFRGGLPHHEIAVALRSMSMVVRPSDTEGLPVTALETMATGIPVIATAVGGTGEVVKDQETGLLLRPDPSPEVIAQAILSLAQNEELRLRLGRVARKASESLDWSYCVGLREEVLRQYARANRKPQPA